MPALQLITKGTIRNNVAKIKITNLKELLVPVFLHWGKHDILFYYHCAKTRRPQSVFLKIFMFYT